MPSEFGHVLNKGVELLTNMPEPRGMSFAACAKVEVNRALSAVTRRHRTRFIAYPSSSSIY